MKRQKTQCTTQPLSRPPKHTHTFDISKAADFQLSFGIEVNISMEPFHPSSQVNGCCFNLLLSTLGEGGGGGVGLKKFSMGRLCPRSNLSPFLYTFMTGKVHLPRSVRSSFLAKSLPFHLTEAWERHPSKAHHREYPPHCFYAFVSPLKCSTLMLHFPQ